ncbi:hypothetical protein Dsin_031474 [Dipteronia sinensis]|uniref:Late embryogenesis abundant protein LEA-2 subgroup domain-containing protein n=1 Tax=Dipteronia sinensis TaxID=43782 RepID=A0AAE0DS82_9ROSI|nr:hypothetical protein Dsin_031474 [Dipteronia sinensis]
MLQDNQNLVPPPQRRNLPRYHQPQSKSSGNCCIKCICCCYCCLFFFIFFVTIFAYILYALYKPQVPNYYVKKFEVTSFDVLSDFSINAEFLVTVEAENRNERIGFIYGKDSAASILYRDKTLCAGKLPAFEQPEKNVTMIKVVLKGKREFGPGLLEKLTADIKAGKVPLLVAVKAPITIVIEKWPLRQVLVKLNCSLVVDNLTTDNKIKILSTKYDYQIMF